MAKRDKLVEVMPQQYDPMADLRALNEIEPLSVRPPAWSLLEQQPGVGGGGGGGAAGKRAQIAKMKAAAEAAPGTAGVKSEQPLGPRISQRYPTSTKPGVEDPFTENLLINTNVLTQDPKKLAQAAEAIKHYPTTTREMLEMAAPERIAAMRDIIKNNLLYLYDLMPAGGPRERSGRWYEGANAISGSRAEQYGIPQAASSGVYASLSPRKDWFQNVELGDRVLSALDANPTITSDVLAKARTINAYKPEQLATMERLIGRKLLNMTPDEQALAMRAYDEMTNPMQYRRVTPEGQFSGLEMTKAGNPAGLVWQSFDNIQKAIKSAMSGGDLELLSQLMGEKHKVRNFFNNINAPWEGAPFGDVTIDTHQIAGGQLAPLGGSSREVLHGLQTTPKKGSVPEDWMKAPESAVTGMQGLYPIYADATRLAGAERGVPTFKMQSVPWETVRSLFGGQKSGQFPRAVEDIWRAFGRGEITQADAQRMITEKAGGFTPPQW